MFDATALGKGVICRIPISEFKDLPLWDGVKGLFFTKFKGQGGWGVVNFYNFTTCFQITRHEGSLFTIPVTLGKASQLKYSVEF